MGRDISAEHAIRSLLIPAAARLVKNHGSIVQPEDVGSLRRRSPALVAESRPTPHHRHVPVHAAHHRDHAVSGELAHLVGVALQGCNDFRILGGLRDGDAVAIARFPESVRIERSAPIRIDAKPGRRCYVAIRKARAQLFPPARE
jgi:hypothetical protein